MGSIMAYTHANGILEIPSPNGQETIHASVQWRLNSSTSHFQTVDVILSQVYTTNVESTVESKALYIQDDWRIEVKKTKALAFLTSAAHEGEKNPYKDVVLKLVLPVAEGYVVRADFLQIRLYGCPNLQFFEGFVAPREHRTVSSLGSFLEILTSAAGGIVVDTKSGKPHASLLSDLETELVGRLSIPWLIPQPIPHRTIAIVGHRALFMMERWFTFGRNAGIDVLVFGNHGSWLEDPKYSNLIKQFIPIDMTADEKFPSRILDVLVKTGNKIDGITSTIDVYFEACAKVSTALGLQTSPLESLAIATDKHATRTLFGHENTFLVSDVKDLQSQIDAINANLTYPLIAKPAKGWSSEGVYKVTNEKELVDAVEKLNRFSPGIKIIVETYADGPEVDANFLMWDGEILFFEVVDDFPSSADEDGATEFANFQELEMVYPSALGTKEKELLRTQIHKFLLEIGFRTGILHVEARVQNSSMEYTKVDGVVDLRPKAEPPTAEPNVFILEVNVRCPGWMVIWATAYTYGIDYAAFQMLSALGDGDRARALSQPFSYGAQATVESVFVPLQKGGTIHAINEQPICEELATRRPDLMQYAVHTQTMAFPGETLPDPSTGTLNFVAAFNLASRDNRTEMLRAGQLIRDAVTADIR